MTGIEAAREVLEEAIMDRASDVHIEPLEKEYKVRFRVDGLLQERVKFEKTDGNRVVSSLKTLAAIDVAEKRKAQDGRFRVRTGVRDVDFRVATAASIYGEKMVLRILDRKGGRLGLTDLGMSKEMLDEFNRIIHSRSGIILATGPTGSGKTSTLYAAISQLDHRRLNIMTIEDPVEYELEGATQIPVNVKAGVTYESGLRSILRQDPDVIFVGEMRDSEAASIAVRAALTGHLVFSSLHTKDAIATVMRLEDLGVERYQISSALLLVVAQRLVRVLCKECREPYQSTGAELKDIGLTLPAGQRIYRAGACEACDHTGYQGRSGIFEMLVLDEELRKSINDSTSQQVQFEIIRKKGFRTYREDGVDKILAGITSVEEVLQAS
jgi:general secretion pathway protein E